jgi:hypothetical protein
MKIEEEMGWGMKAQRIYVLMNWVLKNLPIAAGDVKLCITSHILHVMIYLIY